VTEPTDVSKSSLRGVSPNYTHWCNCPVWSAEDAVGLALGLEPRALNSSHPEHCMPPDLATSYRELLELVRRAVHCGDLKPQFRPVDFLQWTRKLEITIDADLTSAIEKVIRRLGAPDKPQSPRRTDEKIILAVAIAKYGYDPWSPRNAAPGVIAEDCERLNLKVSRDTILDRLNEAKERFDLQRPNNGDD
jgi:hypothetical protein